MADRKGDPAKKPVECLALMNDYECPNLECTYAGYDGERYRCDVCGESYWLDYNEMQ